MKILKPKMLKISQIIGPDLNNIKRLWNYPICEKCERSIHGWRILLIWRVYHAEKCRRKIVKSMKEMLGDNYG